MNRRTFIIRSAALAGLAAAPRLLASRKRPRRILLRSSWQTVNIGDVAHTPGVLTLLERHLPDTEMYLWPNPLGQDVEDMLRRRFPRLIIVRTEEEIARAMDECDFLLHGSGPWLVAWENVAKWRNDTGKPYGVYGITLPTISPTVVELLSGADFVFFRDTVSLNFARESGVKCPIMEFGPDGAFATDLRDDQAATAFLEAHGLEEGKFLCCLSRLRFTPYWRIRNTPFNQARHERNEQLKEHDHAPLREAIRKVVHQTDLKVLLCPEDSTQMAVGKEMILDRLPDDVKSRVVWREKFWLPDEALSTYVRSAGIFGSEMHSPIMGIGNGVPAIVCRWAEQTSKGYMWRDIGLDDWLFDMDKEEEIPGIAPAVLAMAQDPAAAKAKAERARRFVNKRQAETMAILARCLDG